MESARQRKRFAFTNRASQPIQVRCNPSSYRLSQSLRSGACLCVPGMVQSVRFLLLMH